MTPPGRARPLGHRVRWLPGRIEAVPRPQSCEGTPRSTAVGRARPHHARRGRHELARSRSRFCSISHRTASPRRTRARSATARPRCLTWTRGFLVGPASSTSSGRWRPRCGSPRGALVGGPVRSRPARLGITHRPADEAPGLRADRLPATTVSADSAEPAQRQMAVRERRWTPPAVQGASPVTRFPHRLLGARPVPGCDLP